MQFQVLKLDIAGQPSDWISWMEAASLYVRNRVRWEAGDLVMNVRGGFRDGVQSELLVNSIIATDERPRVAGQRAPTLRELYRRDRMCMYCGLTGPMSLFDREHVFPEARGGASTFENMVLSCFGCNRAKSCRTPEEAGMRLLLAVPFKPSRSKLLELQASGRITGCQQAFLQSAAKHQRRH